MGPWYGQAFPTAAALDTEIERCFAGGQKFADLPDYLTKDTVGMKKGDAARGKAVFNRKAQCVKCHKYGNEGEGVGPDLDDAFEAVQADSARSVHHFSIKGHRDQIRSTTMLTKKGF